MNALDILLSILLLIGIVRGFIKGFIFEIAVIGALFFGLFAAFHLADSAAPYILKVFDFNPHTLHYFSFLLVFIAVGIGIFFLAKLFEGLIKIAALGIFNKIVGAVFGGFKYALVISVIIYFFNKADSKYNWISPDKKADSFLYYPLMKIAPVVLPALKETKEKIQDQFRN